MASALELDDDAPVPTTQEEQQSSPSWSDYGKTFVHGSEKLGSSLEAASRYLGDLQGDEDVSAFWGAGQRRTNRAADETFESMSDVAKKRMSAAVTSSEFWEHPFSASALKLTDMSPMVVAAALPGGAFGSVVGGATAVAGTIGGVLGTGQLLDDFYAEVDKYDDKKLQEESELYRGLRSMYDEKDARRQYHQTLLGMKPAVQFALSAAMNAIGPSGMASRALAGKAGALGAAGQGLGRRVATGVLEGAATEGVENAGQDVLGQQAKIEGGLQKDYDIGETVAAGLEGAWLGGLAGAAGGVPKGHEGAAAAKAKPAEATPSVELKGYGTGNAAPPITSVLPEEFKSAKATPTEYPKEVVKSQPAAGVEVVPEKGADAAQAAALTANNENNVAGRPDPVVEAANRVAAQVAQNQPVSQEPSVTVTERPVPPAVAAAVQRVAPQVTEPEVPSGYARFYHGGDDPTSGGGRWVTPDQEYARNFRAEGAPKNVHYVDIPENSPLLKKSFEDEGTSQKAPYISFEAPEEIAKQLKPLKPKAGRILPSLTPEAKAAEKASAGWLEKARINTPEGIARETRSHTNLIKEVREAEGMAPINKKGKAETAAKAKQVDDTKMLFKKHATGAGDAAAVLARTNQILDEAKAQGVKIQRQFKPTSAPVLKWLREVESINIALKSMKPDAIKDRLFEFLDRERAAIDGDWEYVSNRRKESAEEKVKKSGVLKEETVAAPDEYEAAGVAEPTVAEDADTSSNEASSATQVVHREESQDRPAAVSKSGNGGGNFFDEERAEKVAPVRKVEITPEMRAKYETPGKKTVKEPAKKPDIKVTPKVKAVQENVAKSALKAEKPTQEQPAKEPATPKQKIAAAAKEVNTTPSDAQKEAGNYAKGHVKIQGLDVAIENPAGSVRSGKTPEGKEWSTKMPAHYGYIKRTNGADGDQVDVFIGKHPDSQHVMMIDQIDPKTGQFDEHKAMLGFENGPQALAAYEQSFSDGRGLDRIGKITPMTIDEFKSWLKNGNTTEPLGDAVPDEVTVNEALASGLQRGGQTIVSPSGSKIKPMYSARARELLNGLDLGHLTGVPKELAKFFQRKMSDLVGDMPVYIVSKEAMAKYYGTSVEDTHTVGFHNFTNDGDQFVVLRSDQLNNPAYAAHTVLHELAHGMTSRALYEDERFYHLTDAIKKEVQDILRPLPQDDPIHQQLEYALTDNREFIAEAFSNPRVQEALSAMPLSPKMAELLGLKEAHPTVWQAVTDMVRKVVEKALGITIPRGRTIMEGVMRLGEYFETSRRDLIENERYEGPQPLRFHDAMKEELRLKGYVESELRDINRDVRETVNNTIDALRKREGGDGKPWALKWRTMDNIAQVADNYFGHENNPVRQIANAVEKIGSAAQTYFKKSEPIIEKLYNAEQKHTPEVWQEFVDLLHDETMTGVYADRNLAGNSHLGKDTLKGAWGKAKHGELHNRWAHLPDDLKALRAETMKHFTDQQNAQSLGLLRNVMKALGHDDDALVQRAFNGALTDDDIETLGKDVVDAIKDVDELKKLVGPYIPLMRRGDFVVKGNYHITPPNNAKKLSDNEFEFSGKDARKNAMAYAATQDLRPTIKSVWVDKNTGELHFTDEDTGEHVKVLKQDQDAEQRFRVKVQDEHVEFFDTEKQARAAAAKYAEDKLFRDGPSFQERKWEATGRDAMSDAHQVKTLYDAMVKRDGFRDLPPAQKGELEMALKHAALRLQGSTKIQSKRLPRRYVAGASHDLVRNVMDYSFSTANYLAKLDHSPELDAAMKEMRDNTGRYDKRDLGRSAIANEIESRVYGNNGALTKQSPWAQRALTMSFLDKLMSPSYSVINSLQPALLTAPVLAGRHGVTRAVTTLSRAYAEISALKVVGQGAKDTKAKFWSQSAKTSDLIGDIKARIKGADRRAMIDRLVEVGSIDPESGFELGDLIKQKGGVGGQIDTGLGWASGLARQMPKAIEAINRAATALAAYDLERARGADHEAAVQYAQDTVNQTQFNYSATNMPAKFNHPLFRLAFQFKKYAAGIYQLLGMQIGKIVHNARPGDRQEALKTLAGIMATHTAIAGTLGLPTEPFKLLLAGTSLLGGPSMDDIEKWERRQAAAMFGKTGGELLTRGVPRAAGIDLSSRVGLDNLMTFGGPRSEKDADIKSYLWDTAAGPVASLGFDWFKGTKALLDGNVAEAAEKMIPAKFIADSVRAYRRSTEGKVTEGGRKLSKPYSAYEAGARVLGFTPSRDAEEGEKAAAFAQQSNELKSQRTKLINDWSKASNKAAVWSKIQTFNRGQPKNAQITMKQLTEHGKRNKKDGIVTTKGNQHLKDALDQIYSD